MIKSIIVALLPTAFASASAGSFSSPATVRDWSANVVATREGGFRMGKPDAKVHLVEYGSFACPHCGHFEQTGYAPLVQNYVRTGQLAYEFRNVVLNAPDISATLLAHCAGPGRFFGFAKAIYHAQPHWFARVQSMSDAQKAKLDAMSDSARNVRLAQVAGFIDIAARAGVVRARARQCLADPKGLQRLLDETQIAQDAGINRTPTFLIDGKVTTASTWEELQADLDAALHRRG